MFSILKPNPAARLEWSSFFRELRLGKNSENGRRKSCPI